MISVLVIIYFGLAVYKNCELENERKKTNITVEDVEKIEKYINQIYMWKEITQEAIPTFSNINEANPLWLWNAVAKNIEDKEITYEVLMNKSKELFDCNLEFPKEGDWYIMPYDGVYYVEGINLDNEEDKFLISNIIKTENGYEVNIIEYLEDNMYLEENKIIIKNTTGKIIGNIPNTDYKIIDFVKVNKKEFIQKKLILKCKEDRLYVEKVGLNEGE